MPFPRSPYPLGELVGTFRRMFLGADGPQMDPVSAVLSPDCAAQRWVFVGDILPLLFRTATFDAEVIDSFRDADLVIGNLEGIMTSSPWFPFLQKHSARILEVLALLAPIDRWVFSVANNHAGDYGEKDFWNTVRVLEAAGSRVVGRADTPWVPVSPGMSIAAWTEWSNKPAPWVATVAPDSAPEGFRVAFVHWGREFMRTPEPARRLPPGFDAIVGHHPHFPQRVEIIDGTLVAWSLGNFVTEVRLRSMSEGQILRVDVGKDVVGAHIISGYSTQLISIERRTHHNLIRPRRSAIRGNSR